MPSSLLLASLRLFLTPLAAQAELPVASIFAASTGAWEGELYYLDYQSNQRFGIPMRVEAETTPDGGIARAINEVAIGSNLSEGAPEVEQRQILI